MGGNNNPKGKGGFGDNPQNSAKGRWSADTSISHWHNKLIRMDLNEFNEFKPETMAQQMAFNAIKEGKADINYLKEVTDRTEGKAILKQEISGSGGKDLNLSIVSFVDTPKED